MSKKPLILGIESSCDETAASWITENGEGFPVVLSNIVSSQVEVHREFGGVVPELAARSHIEKIDCIVKKAIDESGRKILEISHCVCTMLGLTSRQGGDVKSYQLLVDLCGFFAMFRHPHKLFLC